MSPDPALPAPALPYVFDAHLKTDRLVLRLMTADDVDDVHAYQSREDVCRYQLFEPRNRSEVAERVLQHAMATTLAADGDYLQLAIELPATADARARVIGDTYFTLSSVDNSRGEIGWSLNPEFWGLGYATEAARAVLSIAFDEIGLHRVSAELDPRNLASVALCKRLGMREEAHFVKDLWFKGSWADTGVFSLLHEEWTT